MLKSNFFKNFKFILFFIMIHCSKAYTQNDEFLVYNGPNSYSLGMFGVFCTVIGLLDHFETTSCAGIKVDFGSRGCYYEAEKGLNWWNYYFDPIYLGSKEGAKKIILQDIFSISLGFKPIYELTVVRSHELIRKYIHVKKPIKKKVSAFIKRYFKDNFVIGIHYRGTDKMIQEAPRVSYNNVLDVVKEIINNLDLKDKKFKIFVATDEEGFLDFMKTNFIQSKIIYTNSFRSLDNSNPIHFSIGNKYQKGEEALIDCLLLSKCSYLIRSSSNLSLCASFFNPDLPVTMLNRGVFDK